MVDRLKKREKLETLQKKARTRQAEKALERGDVDKALDAKIEEHEGSITVDEFTQIMKSYFISSGTSVFKTYFKEYREKIGKR